MLAGAVALLVLGAGALYRLASPDRAASAGAVDVTVVAGGADADFERATLAAEVTMAVDHRILPVTFLDTGPMSRDAPPWNVASITVMIRKARGCYPGLSPFVSSAIELPDGSGASKNPVRRQAGLAHNGGAREASPTGGAAPVSNAVTPDTALNDWGRYGGSPTHDLPSTRLITIVPPWKSLGRRRGGSRKGLRTRSVPRHR